ncbi:putative 7-deoxyloganetin glucosyltransferase [Helianthus annuus]|nr:putative 7-deoxyloganetin glucosyltransferase [Helianthus annuus]
MECVFGFPPPIINNNEMDALLKNNEKKPHVVCVPHPTQSYIKGMLKLAKLLHHNGIQITFVKAQSNHYCHFKSINHNGDAGFQFKTVPDGFPTTGDVSEHGTKRNIASCMSVSSHQFLGLL